MTASGLAGPARLREGAEELAGGLPPLLAAAEQLAAAVRMGEHGRRRAGMGDEFWQYRPAHAGDSGRAIDWRRSARADVHFVREKEWQAAQSVALWVDGARSMSFSGRSGRPTKGERARIVALALAVLLIRAGERVGLSGAGLPPRGGRPQLDRLAARLAGDGDEGDYGAPEVASIPPHARAVFLSDFLGDPSAVEAALVSAADRGVKGVLLQVLDPDEVAFPFAGRTLFQSMGGGVVHETRKADDLRDRYQQRLLERQDRISALARRTGWLFGRHVTDGPAVGALLWLYQGLDAKRLQA
ncbi:MAG: DUF58 domain-containing protein [Rhodobacteraceae bacterium]|nr:DUF58 domain-containing protein [Paracoccaceae bacterium]